MKCESCGTNVKDGTAVCPKCDAILDMSAFSDAPPPAEEAEVGPMKPRASSTGAKKVKRTASSAGAPAAKKKEGGAFQSNAVRHMPPAPPRLLKPDPSEVKEDIDWRKMSRDAVAAMKPQDEFKVDHAETPEELMANTKSFIKSLGFSDKIAAGGAAATIISSFFPWKETFDNGDQLGLMSLGAPVFLAAIVVLGAVIARVRNMMPKANPMMLWLSQFGSACFCVLWCLVFIKSAWDPTKTRSPEGNAEMWASSPSMGVVFALLFSIAAVGGTLIGLKEKPKR